MSARIVYHAYPGGRPGGGMKMALRHVETLRELGFDAICSIGRDSEVGTWLDHEAPVRVAEPLRPDDIVVMPEDAPDALRAVAGMPYRKVIFVQGQLLMVARSLKALEAFPAHDPPTVMTVGELPAATVRRLFPTWPIGIVPCFADERRFGPGEKRRAVVMDRKKRPSEPTMIRGFFNRLHPEEADRPWLLLENLAETDVARTLAGADLFLALPRFESVGLASLEAMASGCVCAGFTGIGGRAYATAENGFWVPDDDVEAAADALAQAADVVRTGGPRLAAIVEAGRATAAHWSYARFRIALEDFWMRFAPEARLRNGPLAAGEDG